MTQKASAVRVAGVIDDAKSASDDGQCVIDGEKSGTAEGGESQR
jgi:hypothetical protein